MLKRGIRRRRKAERRKKKRFLKICSEIVSDCCPLEQNDKNSFKSWRAEEKKTLKEAQRRLKKFRAAEAHSQENREVSSVGKVT